MVGQFSKPPVGVGEADRMAELLSLRILDTAASPAFDAIAAGAATLCGTDIGIVSLVDAERQWFKASVGLDGVTETPRDYSFCAHAIMDDETLIIPNALDDERFSSNPLVLEAPSLRFYAGAPIVTRSGNRLGTVCVAHTSPAQLSPDRRSILEHFAKIAGGLIEDHQVHQELLRAARLTINSIGDAVMATDVRGQVAFVNPEAARLTGWTVHEAQGRPIEELLHLVSGPDHAPFENPVRECLRTGRKMSIPIDTVLVNRSGEEFAIDDAATPIRAKSGEIIGAVLVFRDVSVRRLEQADLEHRARHDPLTGALNRNEFELAVQGALEDTRRTDATHTLLFLDLDQFKAINDRLGHAAGDEVLRDTSRVIRSRLRLSDRLGRLGGDEFGVLLHSCPLEHAVPIAEDIGRAIHEIGDRLGDGDANIAASIGVVELNRASTSVVDSRRTADQACYMAKRAGGGQVKVLAADAVVVKVQAQRLDRLNALHRAFEHGGFELYAQPIYRLGESDGLPSGLEILLRMDYGGTIQLPGQFMDVAEQYRLAGRIDRWVVSSALSVLSEFPDAVARLDSVNINLSAQSLERADTAEDIVIMLDDSSVDASKLCFEITESAALASPATSAGLINLIASRGCTFALDDFGKGFSSFGYLKDLPVDVVKIDGMFITDIASDPTLRAMATSIAQISKRLGKLTVAECVEGDDALAVVRSLGIDYAQGFHWGQPEPIIDLLERLEGNPR